jgi:hypothetical protein
MQMHNSIALLEQSSAVKTSTLGCQLFRCPLTCQQVLVDEWRQISIPGGWAIWWRCPECQDWHAVIVDATKHGMREHSSTIGRQQR